MIVADIFEVAPNRIAITRIQRQVSKTNCSVSSFVSYFVGYVRILLIPVPLPDIVFSPVAARQAFLPLIADLRSSVHT